MKPQDNEPCNNCVHWNSETGCTQGRYNSTAMTAFGACGFQREYAINDVIRANKGHGYHFFDDDTMASFNSRIESEVFPNRCFVTSERDKGFRGFDGVLYRAWDGKRRYTVRLFVPETGAVEEASEFGQFATRQGAVNFAKKYEGIRSTKQN